ncbi:unnamed protein product [Cuscuta epithymum]|uniref:Uncharacterized protein n=2 Tax=Cuscuta epithymum TaxID=186058 RepID=A0AAV0ESQ5_9ASTE|nr:unnamed protein product [Cuscuta epithymum]CAH9126163.1 unnamed protein product [Cuscuta epithymum]
MTSILESIFPIQSWNKNDEDGFDLEYSMAVEYSGPPVSYNIPQVVPVLFDRIPAATVVTASLSNSQILSLPVIQPIVNKNYYSDKEGIPEAFSQSAAKVSLNSVYGDDYASNKGSGCLESSGTLGFSDDNDDSGEILASSDVISCEEVEESTPIEFFTETRSSSNANYATTSESDDDDGDDEAVISFPEKSVVISDSKKCFRCHKRNMFIKKEVCLVCNAKYCDRCVLRAMGSMPEGRKCITCIGFRINEAKRDLLGKSSAILKSVLTDEEIKRIMTQEKSCKANQLPSNLVTVNGKHLSTQELVLLQSCPHPPKRLKPGRYWYDKVSGFWGMEGEKPCQIISDELVVGEKLKINASNGNTNVLINGREITGAELRMLKMIGIHCEGSTHFWLQADGTYQQEGMKNVMGNLWERTGINIACAFSSLPTPPKPSNSSRRKSDCETDMVSHSSQAQRAISKLLLVGCDGSGTSTIFKQAKIHYNVPFKEDERECVKCTIQSNLYKYISILFEGRDQFEEAYQIESRRKCIEGLSPSDDVEENIYSISPRLKAFADWLLEVRMSGNLETVFPAATRAYAPLVEELWKDKAFLATYQRRNELHMLPRAANYFLDRAVEISRAEYKPSNMDILYAEGCASANGVASVEVSLPELSKDFYMETTDQDDSLIRCELIRAPARSLGENCKFLEMFEGTNIVLYTVSLTDYFEYIEDDNGSLKNKMLESKKLFESIVTHPPFTQKQFLLFLTKFDILEESIKQFPLNKCEWFRDFNPVISQHSHKNSNNPSLAQRAFYYIASQFKATYKNLTGRKLYVSQLTGINGKSVDIALKYATEILRWEKEKDTVLNECALEITEVTTSV